MSPFLSRVFHAMLTLSALRNSLSSQVSNSVSVTDGSESNTGCAKNNLFGLFDLSGIAVCSFFGLVLLLPFQGLFAQSAAIHFDGTDDHIRVSDHPTLDLDNTSFTLEAWINADSWQTSVFQGNVINKEVSAGLGYMLRVGNSGSISFTFGDGNWYETTVNAILSLNTWHHIAGVWDNSSKTARIYVDGVEVVNRTYVSGSTTVGDNDEDLFIGASSLAGGSRYFHGAIDEVRIWSTARSQSDLQESVDNDPYTSSTGLVAYFPFSGGTPCDDNNSITTVGSRVNSVMLTGNLENLTQNGGCMSNFTHDVFYVPVPNDCPENISAPDAAIRLDGTDDRIRVSDQVALDLDNTSFTLEARIKADSWQTNVFQGNVINKEVNAFGGNRGYMLRVGNNGRVNFNFGDNNWHEITSGPVLHLNFWHHIAGVWDNSSQTARIYVDGVEVATNTFLGSTVGDNDEDLFIGSDNGAGGSRYFHGAIDEVRIWSTARSQSDLQESVNNVPFTSSTGLIAYFPFNEGDACKDNTSITSVGSCTSSTILTGTLENMTLSGGCLSNFTKDLLSCPINIAPDSFLWGGSSNNNQ